MFGSVEFKKSSVSLNQLQPCCFLQSLQNNLIFVRNIMVSTFMYASKKTIQWCVMMKAFISLKRQLIFICYLCFEINEMSLQKEKIQY